MVRATRKSVEQFIMSDYVKSDESGLFIPKDDAQTLMDDLMAKFSGICCGIIPDPIFGMSFLVQSSATRKQFFTLSVRG